MRRSGEMRERNIVVLPLSPLLSEVSGKCRIPKADIFGGIVKGVTQIARAAFLHVRISSRQRKLPGLVSRGRHPRVCEDLIRRVEAGVPRCGMLCLCRT